MKNEGALPMRFLRHGGIYRSDVSSSLVTPGPRSRSPVGPVPGYRASRKEHALPIVCDEFRPVIPRRVARQHCPSPLHRHPQHKAIGAFRERVYHRTVRSVLTVCLTKRGNPKYSLQKHSMCDPKERYALCPEIVNPYERHHHRLVSKARSLRKLLKRRPCQFESVISAVVSQ